jgi:hypothetical protein
MASCEEDPNDRRLLSLSLSIAKSEFAMNFKLEKQPA